MNTTLATAIIALTLSPGGAEAQTFNAQASGAVNLRVGPGVAHTRITTIPASAPITVHYCLPSPAWCQVTYGATTGWASARYVMPHQPVAQIAAPRVVHVVHLNGNTQGFRLRLQTPFVPQYFDLTQPQVYPGYGYSYAIPTYPFVAGYRD